MWFQSKLNEQISWKGISVSLYANVRSYPYVPFANKESSYLNTRPLKGEKKKVIQFQGRCLTDGALVLREAGFSAMKGFILA